MGIEWITLLIGAIIFFGIRAAAGAGVGAILLVTVAALVLLGGGRVASGGTADIGELLDLENVTPAQDIRCDWQSDEGAGLVEFENVDETPVSFRISAVLGGDPEVRSRELTYPAGGAVFTLGPGQSVAKLLEPPRRLGDKAKARITWCDARMVDIERW